jgi:hypothetical protein
MDIKLKNGKKTLFAFSLLPAEINCSFGTNYQNFDIISAGTIAVPKGRDVTEISWDGEFFGESKQGAAGVKTALWKDPNTCVKELWNLQKKKTIMKLVVSGTWIAYNVTIASFTPTPHGGYGDVRYSITFKVYRNLKIKTMKETKKSSSGKKKSKTRSKKTTKANQEGNSNYVVKKGDTLSRIALKKMGSARKWTKIYTKNKSVIEKTAKKHGYKNSDRGHWIFPGEKLVIPSS